MPGVFDLYGLASNIVTTIQHFKVKNKIKTETKIRYNQTHTRHRRTKSGVKFGVWLALRVERNLHYNTFKKETIQSTEGMHQDE